MFLQTSVIGITGGISTGKAIDEARMVRAGVALKDEGMTNSGRMHHCVDCRAAILAANKRGTAAKIAALQFLCNATKESGPVVL